MKKGVVYTRKITRPRGEAGAMPSDAPRRPREGKSTLTKATTRKRAGKAAEMTVYEVTLPDGSVVQKRFRSGVVLSGVLAVHLIVDGKWYAHFWSRKSAELDKRAGVLMAWYVRPTPGRKFKRKIYHGVAVLRDLRIVGSQDRDARAELQEDRTMLTRVLRGREIPNIDNPQSLEDYSRTKKRAADKSAAKDSKKRKGKKK